MKKYLFMGMAFAMTSLIISCDKNLAPQAEDEIARAKSNTQRLDAHPCSECVDTWSETEEVVATDGGSGLSVTMSHDANFLYIMVTRVGGTFTKMKSMVVTQDGNIILDDNAPFGAGNVTTLTRAIALDKPFSKCDPIVAEFEVVGVGGGGGKLFDEVSYALYELCTPPPPCVLNHRTQSHGYFMASPPGARFLTNNPGLGPVTIGCDGNEKTFTLAEIVAMQPGNSTYPGILGKQIIALTLNINASALWGKDDLGCLIINTGNPMYEMWNGYTVAGILDLANAIWGGCDEEFTPAQVNAIVDAINNNFLEGTTDNELLTCSSLCD